MAEVLLLIGIGLILLLLFVFVFLIYSGLFDTIDVSTGRPTIGQTVIAYKYATGPYKEAGHLFSEISKVFPKMTRCLGIYYDDPGKVEGEKCRYIAGAVLAEGDEKVDQTLKQKYLDAGCKTITLPSVTSCVKSKFSLRSSLSLYIAIFRVYPKITKYISERRLKAYPCLEYYHDNMMEFMAPLMKQDGFYVEEALPDNQN